jgi:hypothetical protein
VTVARAPNAPGVQVPWKPKYSTEDELYGHNDVDYIRRIDHPRSFVRSSDDLALWLCPDGVTCHGEQDEQGIPAEIA